MNRLQEIEREARLHHEKYPELWNQFVRFTFELIRAGNRHGGAGAVFERIRWETAITHGESFKANNNFRSVYARWFETAFPEHRGFFRNRVQKSAYEPAKGNETW